MMKQLFLFFSLLFTLASISQNDKQIPPPPPVYLNSLLITEKTNSKGLTEYYYNYKNKKIINNRIYGIEYKKLIDYKVDYCTVEEKTEFTGKDTRISFVGSFKNHLKNGIWKTLYFDVKTLRDRTIKIENWNNGLLVYKYAVYDFYGKKIYSTNFGKKGNGEYRDFYLNSTILKEKGNYKEGKKEGKWYYYNKKGKLKLIKIYKSGMLQK